MAKFICPECRREVVAGADLEGRPADCARCGAAVAQWPAPVRTTRKPAGLGGQLFQYAALVVFVVLVLMVLKAVFDRN